MITQFTEVIESNNFLSKDTNTFISEDDIYCNFNQFINKTTHICFVTGFSGSGKSTLARKLARKYNAEYIELDLITFAASKRSVTFDWLNSKGEYLLIDYIKQQRINPTDISDKYSYDQRLKFMDGFISWLINTNRKRCIVEGVNLIEIFPMHSEWKSLPFVFKGTSLLKSVIRRISRSGGIDINNIDDLLKTVKSWDNMYRGNQAGYDYIRNKVMRHKGVEIDEVDEDSLTAKKMGIIFSDDDIHYNVQRFMNKEVPVLWITGVSGGGKSTLAKEIADKAPGVVSLLSIDNLDDFVGMYVVDHDMKTINEWIHWDKVYDLIYRFIKANEQMTIDAFNDTHNKSWQDFVATVLKHVLKFYTPKKQIIIEGVQIPYVYYRAPELFRSDSAIIIKGTSVFTSLIRRYHRDQDRGWFINKFSDIKKYFDMYSMWYRTQNDFRNHVTPNTESYIAGYDTFKVHPQTTEYTCGPACVMMVLNYYGMLNGETEASLTKELDTDNYTGTHVSAIEYYFKCKGWTVNSSNIEGSPSKYEDFKLWLDYNLSHNNPIMVENKALDGHWRVIIGFDEDNETLLVADPYTKINDGINVINAHDFFTTWYDTINNSVKAWVTAKPPK